MNDPGRSEWEGSSTVTRAAAAGGITTLVDMPLNPLRPATTVDNLWVMREVACAKAHIDAGSRGGAVPGDVKDLRPLHEAGVFGSKCFHSPSGATDGEGRGLTGVPCGGRPHRLKPGGPARRASARHAPPPPIESKTHFP
ncbi:Allantoinase [Streptomyces sp. ADI95-17]|nr:Allantoinase [Streptomyces sp. ADI95-17]